MRSARRVLGGLLILLMAGCTVSPPAPPEGVEVSGKILLPNGSPLTGGTLVLRPEGGLHGATAQIQSDGSFTLMDTHGRKAVVPGKYQVFVRLGDATKASLRSQVNSRYQNTEDGDSDVVVDIQAATSNLTIQLKR